MDKKRVSRDAVAKAAGVSASTVSRALNDSPLLPVETRRRVQAAARELGYQIHAGAQSLASRRCNRIGFAMPGDPAIGALRLGYYADILGSCVQQAAERNHDVGIILHNDKPSDITRFQSQLQQSRVDSFVVLGLRQRSPLAQALRKAEVPCILIGSRIAGMTCIDFEVADSITSLADRAAAQDRQRVVLVTGDPAYRATANQLAAWDAVQTRGIVDCSRRVRGDFAIGASRRALGGLEHLRDIDLIACANDRSAIGVYQNLRERGLKPGRDIAVCGFDDDDHARVLSPSLSTVRQPQADAGRLAVDLIVEQHLHSDTTFLPTTTVWRESF
ncbi:MAG: LacI family DNA-binding transcriptional regulator [Planctomycetota bacterium]